MNPLAPSDEMGSTSADGDTAAAILLKLERACEDTSLSEETRGLLAAARSALLTAKQDAATARQRYRNLFDAVPDPVSIIAEDGTVLDLNRAGSPLIEMVTEADITGAEQARAFLETVQAIAQALGL